MITTSHRHRYDVIIDGKNCGRLEWRGYRLLWIKSANDEKLFHRGRGLKAVRDYIATTIKADKSTVKLQRIPRNP